MLRDAAISLSLANLCFVKVWGRALSGAGAYFNEFPIAYTSIVLDVLLLAAVFFTGITIARRSQQAGKRLPLQIARCAFVLALLTALNGIAMLIMSLSAVNWSALMGRDQAYFAGVGITAAAVLLAIKGRDIFLRFGPRVILALLPFVLVTFSQVAWKITKNTGVVLAASQSQGPVLKSRKTPATRVLWIVFDEMDQRLSFGERPATVRLPELDRLQSQSVYAVNAYPPAPLTYMSIPALLTGKLVGKVTPLRADELMIQFDNESEAVGWSTQPNVFSEAQRSGFTTGLVGWCHPYCEVIGGSLSMCDEVKEKKNAEITLKTSMFSQAEALISTIPLVTQAAVPVIQRVDFINQIATTSERQKYTARYKRVTEGTLKAAVDPNLDLIFVHSPAPHPPGIYDRETHSFSVQGKNSYLDNLALVDQMVADLRRAMEQAGMWDQTTIIISADHWWRSEMWRRGPFWTREDAAVAGRGKMDHRVPFLLKLAGQHDQLTYTPGFNTVITHDLVLALLRGEISSPKGVAAWLDQHHSITDSPYNQDELLP